MPRKTHLGSWKAGAFEQECDVRDSPPDNPLNLHIRAHHLVQFHGLPNPKIQHDLLRSSRNSKSPHLPVYPLDLLALAASHVARTAKDLTCLPSTILEHFSGLHLQKRGSSTKSELRFLEVHMQRLIGHKLEHRVDAIDLASHLSEFPSNHSVFNEFLSKGLSLVSIIP